MIQKLRKWMLKLTRRGGSDLDPTPRTTSGADRRSTTEARQVERYSARSDRARQEASIRRSVPGPENNRYG